MNTKTSNVIAQLPKTQKTEKPVKSPVGEVKPKKTAGFDPEVRIAKGIWIK